PVYEIYVIYRKSGPKLCNAVAVVYSFIIDAGNMILCAFKLTSTESLCKSTTCIPTKADARRVSVLYISYIFDSNEFDCEYDKKGIHSNAVITMCFADFLDNVIILIM